MSVESRRVDDRAQQRQDRLEWPMVIAARLVIPVRVIEDFDY